MEHTTHLASKAFLEEICPTPSRYKRKAKSTADTSNEDDGDDFEEEDDLLDDEVAWLASLVNEAAAPEDEEVDEDMDFDPGDLLGKVLALINQVGLSVIYLNTMHLPLSSFIQVRASPQAKTFFATMCHEEGLKPLELIKWVRTCWGSMYDLIDRILANRSVSYM